MDSNPISLQVSARSLSDGIACNRGVTHSRWQTASRAFRHGGGENNGNVRAVGNYFTLYYAWHAPIRRLFAQSFGRTRHRHAFLYEWRLASDKCHVSTILYALIFSRYPFFCFSFRVIYFLQVIFRSWNNCSKKKKRNGNIFEYRAACKVFEILIFNSWNSLSFSWRILNKIYFLSRNPVQRDELWLRSVVSRQQVNDCWFTIGGIHRIHRVVVSSEIWQPQANARQGSTSKDWCRFESHNPNTCWPMILRFQYASNVGCCAQRQTKFSFLRCSCTRAYVHAFVRERISF